ncbi:MAG TPA: hypothetical protein VHX61_12310 [Rhizomicrobium sp.]|nr:hypothetical protein [Rhizomicrobium sp.]
MNLKTTAIAIGLASALGAGTAFAQQGPQQSPYDQGSDQQAPGRKAPHRHHHGVLALIRDEMSAGRLSKKEASLLEAKIKQLHAQKRAEREARYGGEGPSNQSQMQP